MDSAARAAQALSTSADPCGGGVLPLSARKSSGGAGVNSGRPCASFRDLLPSCEGIDTALLYRQATEQLARIEAGDAVNEFPRIHLYEDASVSPVEQIGRVSSL